MNHRIKHCLAVAFMMISVSLARADLITFEITASTSRALADLGTKVVISCVVLALGIVIAAVVSRKK